ncbi:MAG: hypothetical protein JO197_11675 [Acidobacteria bacterium]|nr:hypothetical protein [Acidobacteriota bacterium]MBV9476135.1 hypothetical protein [Acidobacteriota bacterium]
MQHPAYRKSVDGYTGAGGITWLHRWAITEGRDRAIFAGEPRVPHWVEQRDSGARPLRVEARRR